MWTKLKYNLQRYFCELYKVLSRAEYYKVVIRSHLARTATRDENSLRVELQIV